MKTAILFGVAGIAMLAACGGTQGTSEGVGNTGESIALSGLNTPTGYAEAKSPAYIKLSSTEVLMVGGYSSSGAAVSTIRKFTYTGGTDKGTWSSLVSGGNTLTLNQARGDAQIVQIPGQTSKYLVLGGRSNETTNSRLDTAEIIDVSVPSVTALTNSATHKLASPRIGFTVTKCGTSNLLIAGGQENTPSAVDTLEVFTFDSGTPANSTFALLTNTSSSTVVMATARMFHSALSFSTDTKIRIVGGEDGSGSYFGSNEKIDVNSSCQVTNDRTVLGVHYPAVGAALPSSALRSQAVFAPVSLSIGSPAVSYEAVLVAGRDDTSTLPLSTFGYDVDGDAWTTSTPSLASGRGHIRPAFAADPSGNFAIVGGSSATTVTSTNKVDYFTNSGTGSWAGSPTDMTNARYGAAAAYIGSAYIALHGMNTTGPTYYNQPE